MIRILNLFCIFIIAWKQDLTMKIYLIFFSIIIVLNASAQYDFDVKGYSAYKAYDDSFITPNLRGKHSISFGGLIGMYGTQTGAIFTNESSASPNFGIHLGYNYIVLSQRILKSSKKNKTRDELKYILGAHLNILSNNDMFLMATFYKKLIGTNGRLFSWSFFSEYGLGIHKSENVFESSRPLKIDLSLEIFRMRFVKQPLFLHGQFNYATSNDFLSKDKLNLGFYGGIRYYFYKKKV